MQYRPAVFSCVAGSGSDRMKACGRKDNVDWKSGRYNWKETPLGIAIKTGSGMLPVFLKVSSDSHSEPAVLHIQMTAIISYRPIMEL